MHAQLEPLAGLVGTWRGIGTASYPTMASDISYTDEVSFSDIGKPLLVYGQRTWAPDGRLMHVETGYLRVVGEGRIEFVIALPSGQTELAVGEYRCADELVLTSDGPAQNTPTAKQVDRIGRSYRLAGDQLTYEVTMEAVGVAQTTHLRAELTRE